MTREVRIEHADGTTSTLTHLGHRTDEKFREKTKASVRVPRQEATDADPDPSVDEVYFHIDGTDEFGGLLSDVVAGKKHSELIVDSFEQYARDAKPTGGGNIYNGASDSLVVNDALSDVSELSAGTVNTVQSSVSLVFSHASQAHKMRKVEEVTDGELYFHPDKTVDYVDSIGADKTGTTLSAANQNISGEMEVSRIGGDERVTHLRALGAGEGTHQVEVEVVAPSYSAGDPQKWRTYTDKGITSEDALQSLADRKIAELNSEYIEVEVTVRGETVNLGDEFHVEKSKEGVDHNMRVVELTSRLDTDGREYDVVLSNRSTAREKPADKRRKDMERFNLAVQGVAVPINAGGSRAPVNSNVNYKLDFYYPAEVVYEHRLNVRVIGDRYRSYSSGAQSGGDHTHDVDVTHPAHDHGVTVTHPSHTHPVTVTHPSHTHPVEVTHPSHSHDVPISSTTDSGAGDSAHVSPFSQELSMGTNDDFKDTVSLPFMSGGDAAYALCWMNVQYTPGQSGIAAGSITITNESQGRMIYDEYEEKGGADNTYDSGDTSFYQVVDAEGSVEGNVFGFQFETSSTGDGEYRLSYGVVGIGDHQHDINISATASTELGTTEDTTAQSQAMETTSATADSEPMETTSVTADSQPQTTSTESSSASGGHTHDPDPGLIEHLRWPGNCDILVNGTSLGTSFGDTTSRFEESVSIAGKDLLNEGQVNTLEVTSDSLGHVQAYLEGDVYRQILGNG